MEEMRFTEIEVPLNSRVYIGDDISLLVYKRPPFTEIAFGINAPKHIHILRSELIAADARSDITVLETDSSVISVHKRNRQ